MAIQKLSYADDTRGRKPAPLFRSEIRNRFRLRFFVLLSNFHAPSHRTTNTTDQVYGDAFAPDF